MQDYAQAYQHIALLTGSDPDGVHMWFRAINDRDKGVAAHNFEGSLHDCWQQIVTYQSIGWGIFVNVNPFDGRGRELPNIAYIRAHFADFDNISARHNCERACNWTVRPTFAVNSSPEKFHCYWNVEPYTGVEYFTDIQRKIRQLFDTDKATVDATRVLRLAGTVNFKRDVPHLVTCWPVSGARGPVTAIADALAGVTVVGGSGGRHPLGDPELAAPSIEWLQYALDCCDPNKLDRPGWMAITAAVKQAGTSLADPATLRGMWDAWCARYDPGEVGSDGKPLRNDAAENEKMWSSIRDSETGWKTLLNRVDGLNALFMFRGVDRSGQVQQPPSAPPTPQGGAQPDITTATGYVPGVPDLTAFGDILTHDEQRDYFNGCVYVTNLGDILTSANRFLNTSEFNAVYGGKKFVIDNTGKITDEAAKAALRSTLFKIPVVDHIRFVPDMPFRAHVSDDMGRVGINMYKPVNPKRVKGDPSPFLRHMAALIPDDGDRKIVFDYMAHNVRFPGHKIAWAPLIQSTEGAGKGVIKAIMRHAMGRNYVYFPKASELANSGATFNAWLRNKLFILVDEIKVDERRELIEVLKPLISEKETEIQAKGKDQDVEDNYSNWFFFSNWRDAIPINKNGRRYAIIYSPLQTVADLQERQMGEWYFNELYRWLDGDGAAIVTDWLLDYPIERGAIPQRAPKTSSTDEAVRMSRGPIERLIVEAVEDQLPGFRFGWISSGALIKRMKANGSRAVSAQTIDNIMSDMGYTAVGRAPRAYFAENADVRSYLYHVTGRADVEGFGKAQGYE